MESKTKVQLPLTTIASLVQASFGQAPVASITELKDGWFNTAYRITFERGHAPVVLKVGPLDEAEILSYEKDIMRTEVEVMDLLSSDPSIPVPCILFSDFSRTHLPNDYYFMEALPGTPWNKCRKSLSAAQNQALERQLGEITAHINAFEHPTFGYYAFSEQFDTWREAFRFMCALLFSDAEHYAIELPITASAFMELFDAHAEHFSEITRPQLVHWDLWEGNAFVDFRDGEPFISGVIDFERAYWGDPLSEHFFGREENAQHFIAGYGQNLLSTPSQTIRRIFYNLYLYLVMIIEDGPRQYTDKGPVKWALGQLEKNIERL